MTYMWMLMKTLQIKNALLMKLLTDQTYHIFRNHPNVRVKLIQMYVVQRYLPKQAGLDI